MNIPSTDQKRIVIVGAGFAGLTLAKNLKNSGYQVVLLDKNNYHTFQPLLYQVATSGLEPDSITYPIRKVFQHFKDFFFRIAKVEKVDTDNKLIFTHQGDLSYDYLVMATGATTNYFGNQRVEQLSMSLKSIKDALDLRSLLLQNLEEALIAKTAEERQALMNVVIVGAGPTGVELAGALAELKMRVLPSDYPDLDFSEMNISLVQGADRILPAMSGEASEKSLKYLCDLGVDVQLNKIVEDYDGHCIITNEGNLPARTLIWSAGVMGNPIQGAGEANRGGRVEVDQYLRLKGVDDVFSIGDVAAMVDKDLPRGHPMLASVACQQGTFLAENMKRMAEGKELELYVFKDKGTMATVGRNKAVADLPKFKTQGILAWYLWMFVHLFLLVGFRNRLVAFIDWVYSYITYDTGIRLIIRPFQRKELPKEKEKSVVEHSNA